MGRAFLLCGLLVWMASPLVAQTWTPEDSLRLHQLLNGEGEIRLNPEALKELQRVFPGGEGKMSDEKPWLEFDTTLPVVNRKLKRRLTLYPYTPTTHYNWDPVLQRKIDIDAPSWEQSLALSLRSQLVGAVKPSGHDFMAIFTREFWNRKIGRRRARTLEVLKAYGDSVTVHQKQGVNN